MEDRPDLPATPHSYNGHWRNVTQQLVFLGALMVYLESETLLTLEDFQQLVGATPRLEPGFYVDLEDYLYGVCSLPSELVG